MTDSSEQYSAVPSSTRSGWPWQSVDHKTDTDYEEIDWPKITVVTPSFNQGQFLEATLRSVILQYYPNLEYLVLDGGSTDNSVQIIKEYETHLTYWRSKSDQGQADALATGFEMATGEIFCWLNSDDILLSGTLRVIGRYFMVHRNIDFLYGNSLLIDQHETACGQHIWLRFLTRYHWHEGQPMAQECCFWRKQLYRDVGGLNRSLFFIMDYELFYRMWCKGRFAKINRFLGCLRIHDDSKNTKHQAIRIQELADVQRQYEIRPPGKIIRRLLSRSNRMQIWFERLFVKSVG